MKSFEEIQIIKRWEKDYELYTNKQIYELNSLNVVEVKQAVTRYLDNPSKDSFERTREIIINKIRALNLD